MVVLLVATVEAWEGFEGAEGAESRSSSCSDLGLLWDGIAGDGEGRGGWGSVGEWQALQS